MCDVWTGQRNRPLRLLAVAAGEQGEWMAREIGGKEEKAPFCLMQSGADQAAGAELLYLTVGAEAYREVAELARWARQRGGTGAVESGRAEKCPDTARPGLCDVAKCTEPGRGAECAA